jgi:hypothetical protein
MDIEVIVKRALVYAAALSAIVAIYCRAAGSGRQRLSVSGGANQWVIAFFATLVLCSWRHR